MTGADVLHPTVRDAAVLEHRRGRLQVRDGVDGEAQMIQTGAVLRETVSTHRSQPDERRQAEHVVVEGPRSIDVGDRQADVGERAGGDRHGTIMPPTRPSDPGQPRTSSKARPSGPLVEYGSLCCRKNDVMIWVASGPFGSM